ncbi:MAG: hypothetical protein SNJ29_10830 [Rikenellaceae bacterium]
MINRVKTILIAVVLCCCIDNLSAQDNQAKSKERDVKVSGNYYYGDGSSNNEVEAKNMAIEELKMMISESVRVTNPDIATINFSGFDNSIGTLSIDLDGYVRVIAFVLKKDVILENQGAKILTVMRISADVTEEKSNVAEQEISAETIPIASNTNPVAEEPVAIAEEPKQTNNAIINEITKLVESKDVGVLLNKYKNLGKLGYGRLSTISDPEKCYFVVLRSGKLIDVLNQGTATSREGLMSGAVTDYTKCYDTIYWVYIY